MKKMKFKTKQTIAGAVVAVLIIIIAPICVEQATWVTLACIAVSGCLIRAYGLGEYKGD